MFKEIVISLVIIIAIIIGNILSQNYTKNSVEKMNNDLYGLRENLMVDEKNLENLNKEIKDIYSQWSKMYEKMAYFIEHDELEKVQTQLTAIKGNIEVKEYEQSVPELDKCIFILNHIKDKEALRIQNIF